MAKVWFCREGDRPTDGGPAYILGLDECIDQLGLLEARFLCEPSSRPAFGDPADPLGRFRSYKYVVVEIDEGEVEGRDSKWRPGFYLSPLPPDQAIKRLGPPRLPWE